MLTYNMDRLIMFIARNFVLIMIGLVIFYFLKVGGVF
jgi:hypothetical protein